MIVSYLIKSSLILLIVLVFYKLVLQKEKMCHFNRAYLLFGLLLSLIVPLLETGIQFSSPDTLGNIPSNALTLPIITEGNILPEDGFDWTFIMVLSYGLVALCLTIRFYRNIRRIIHKAKGAVNIPLLDSTLVLQEKNESPHTFMKNIFLHKRSFEQEKIEEAILIHERAHARQLHSLDIILMEVYMLVFWFNPIVYAYKAMMQLNHEFLADQAVLDEGSEPSFYKRLLLGIEPNPSVNYMASNINFQITKKRLKMMNKASSKWRSSLCAFSTLPVLLFLLLVFGQESIAQSESTNKVMEAFYKEAIFQIIDDEGNIFIRKYKHLSDQEKSKLPPPPPLPPGRMSKKNDQLQKGAVVFMEGETVRIGTKDELTIPPPPPPPPPAPKLSAPQPSVAPPAPSKPPKSAKTTKAPVPPKPPKAPKAAKRIHPSKLALEQRKIEEEETRQAQKEMRSMAAEIATMEKEVEAERRALASEQESLLNEARIVEMERQYELKEKENEWQERERERFEAEREQSSIPPPPPPPPFSIEELAKEGAIFYYKGNKISKEKAIEMTELVPSKYRIRIKANDPGSVYFEDK